MDASITQKLNDISETKVTRKFGACVQVCFNSDFCPTPLLFASSLWMSHITILMFFQVGFLIFSPDFTILLHLLSSSSQLFRPTILFYFIYVCMHVCIYVSTYIYACMCGVYLYTQTLLTYEYVWRSKANFGNLLLLHFPEF